MYRGRKWNMIQIFSFLPELIRHWWMRCLAWTTKPITSKTWISYKAGRKTKLWSNVTKIKSMFSYHDCEKWIFSYLSTRNFEKLLPVGLVSFNINTLLRIFVLALCNGRNVEFLCVISCEFLVSPRRHDRNCYWQVVEYFSIPLELFLPFYVPRDL